MKLEDPDDSRRWERTAQVIAGIQSVIEILAAYKGLILLAGAPVAGPSAAILATIGASAAVWGLTNGLLSIAASALALSSAKSDVESGEALGKLVDSLRPLEDPLTGLLGLLAELPGISKDAHVQALLVKASIELDEYKSANPAVIRLNNLVSLLDTLIDLAKRIFEMYGTRTVTDESMEFTDAQYSESTIVDSRDGQMKWSGIVGPY